MEVDLDIRQLGGEILEPVSLTDLFEMLYPRLESLRLLSEALKFLT